MKAFPALILAALSLPAADPSSPEFFDAKVRPLLAHNCLSCHTQSKLGGLELTSREALLKGGNSGPAIVPGKPAESLLFQAVSHTHAKLKMPPAGKQLAAEDIDTLKQWIAAGATWPETTETPKPTSKYTITKEQRQYWAFQPIKNPTPPTTKNKSWPANGIDNFLLAALESKNESPAPNADCRTLIRRATFDLHGLPPTPEATKYFCADKSPQAYSKLLDTLLASKHYGERWGRHWLDVARYSDDKLNSTMDEPRPNAFRYRDWVVDALNNDLPYDKFVKAQIAGDLMNDPSLIAATGLYALSPEFQDDRVDVTTRGFLALTVACAQCHDHKFDPIPTRDYYSLLGIFNSSKTTEHPLAEKSVVDAWTAKKKTLDKAKEDLQAFYDQQSVILADILAASADKYLAAAHSDSEDPKELDKETLKRLRDYFKRENRLSKPDSDPAKFRDQLLAVSAEKKEVDKQNLIRLGGSNERRDLSQANLTSLSPEQFYLFRDFLSNRNGVFHYGPGKIERFLSGLHLQHLENLKQAVKTAEKELPPQYPFLHALADIEKPRDEKIHIRGNRANLGDPAPRGWLTILSKAEPEKFTQGSGRLQLAESIASPDNPLTARVIVNRLWQDHFGQGIVATTSNFGRLGETPSNPELLDYLATRLIAHNWSLKSLHKEIMLSSHYRSQRAPRRLDAESLRDAILKVSDRLDTTIGGKPFDLSDAKQTRRTLYGFVSRRKTDTMLNLFDFPNPNATSDRRYDTDVPLQRLFLLNSPLMVQSADALNKALPQSPKPDRVTAAYQQLFTRNPTKQELAAATTFIKADADWPLYLQTLLSTDEFLHAP